MKCEDGLLMGEHAIANLGCFVTVHQQEGCFGLELSEFTKLQTIRMGQVRIHGLANLDFSIHEIAGQRCARPIFEKQIANEH